jgi:hypothetical protein
MYVCLVEEHGGGADPLVEAEEFVQGGFTQIGVDESDPLASLSKGNSKIGNDRRFPIAG